MSSNANQFQSPYLLTSRKFPQNPVELESVLSKAYIDTANNVNISTCGIYDKVQIDTRNKYYNDAQPEKKRQSYRRVYTIAALPNTATATIATGISFTSTSQLVNIYGTAESATIAVALTPWVVGTPNDAPYLRVNKANGNIEIITTTGNWTSFSAMIVLEYILN
jgi:hypothetical protein